MTRTAQMRLPLIGAFAALVALASGLGLLAFAGSAGPLAGSGALGFAQSHEARAFQLLSRPTSAGSLRQAEAEARQALRLSPYNNAARLRLSYIGTVRDGHLTSEGLKNLATSYELVPFDYTIAAWRIQFALEHWEAVSPDVRASVFAEAMAFGKAGSQDVGVRKVLASIHDPAGRVAAALWLRALTK